MIVEEMKLEAFELFKKLEQFESRAYKEVNFCWKKKSQKEINSKNHA